jgi:hypothetical protein
VPLHPVIIVLPELDEMETIGRDAWIENEKIHVLVLMPEYSEKNILNFGITILQ